jgi:ligand-binding SRPBCC domain-containing protein
MRLVFEHACGAPVERVFAFHQDPDNLALLLRGWRSFRMISNSGHVGVGGVTRVSEQLGPFRLPMTFEHFVYEPPIRFGERQVQGPFAWFEHVHEFEPVGSGTLIRDVVDAELPWYLGGALATRWVVVPRLRRFFRFRHREIDRLLREGAFA